MNLYLFLFSVINSETGNTSNEVIDFGILCPWDITAFIIDVTTCGSYDWNGIGI